MPLLQVTNLTKELPKGLLINNINLQQEVLQKMAIAGVSGSGKTSFLKMVAGLMQPDTGNILLNGKRVIGPYEQLLPGHKQIGYLSQHYELRNNYKVEDLIWFDNKLDITEANEIFEICNIYHLLSRRTDELSGGEKQRIGLCMLLVKKPLLLLLDEPFSNLDLIHKTTLKKVFDNISSQLKITILLASHDPMDTLSWADEIIVMKEGSIVQQAKPEVIYNNPDSEYVAALFGDYNKFTASQLTDLFGLKNSTNENSIYLIRPEHISITSIDKAMATGQIVSINFYGNYYSVKVAVKEASISIAIPVKNISIGDTIGLKIEADKLIEV